MERDLQAAARRVAAVKRLQCDAMDHGPPGNIWIPDQFRSEGCAFLRSEILEEAWRQTWPPAGRVVIG